MKKFNDIFYKNIKSGIESIEDPETGKLIGINLSFQPIHEDKVYHKSTGDVVPVLPTDLSIKLDMRNLITFNSLLLETISSYLYNLRKKVLKTDLIEVLTSKLDDKYKIRVRVSRHFFREEEKGRYKISIAFLNKETEEEVVNINLTKRDILVMIGLLRKITTSFGRETGIFVPAQTINVDTNEIIDTSADVIVAKIDNSILIDNIWLHGQEIMNSLFTVQELIYKLNIENNLKNLQSIYRQITFVEKDEILYLELEKMNSSHEKEDNIIDGINTKIRLPFTGKLLSALFLFLDITILRHADFEDEDDNVEIIGKENVFEGEKVKYHMSLKESVLAVGIKNRKNKPNESRVMFFGKTKEGAFTEFDEYGSELQNYIKKYNESGESELVPVLTGFNINLKDQWIKLVRGLSMAYTQEYIEKRERNIIKFFVINQGPDGRFKYDFKILGDPNNKATSVLIIDKYRLKNREEIFEGRFRQPLFKKYVFQLITIILAAARDIHKIKLSEEKDTMDLLRYNYKSFKKVKEVKKSKVADYGIEKNGDEVWLGNFAIDGLAVKLVDQDIELLNITSLFRIYNGYWLPFTGDKVAIGQDGYLTDMFGEVNLEENYGTDWATRIYFGTTEEWHIQMN